MLYNFNDLPPDAEPDIVTYGTGHHTKNMAFYRVPTPRGGPELREDAHGRHMVYMYGHYVFRWYAGSSTVSISHGNIDGTNNMSLPWTFTIERQWNRSNLAELARAWLHEHLRSFQRSRPDDAT